MSTFFSQTLSCIVCLLLICSQTFGQVSYYFGNEMYGSSVAARTALDTQAASWTGSFPSGAQFVNFAFTADPDASVYTMVGSGYTVDVTFRDMTNSTIGTLASSNGVISTTPNMQANSPKPLSRLNEPRRNDNTGSSSSRNALLMEFSTTFLGVGFWIGDIETRTDGSGTGAILRLLDINDIVIDEVIIPTSTANQSLCGNPVNSGEYNGCGNGAGRYIAIDNTAGLPIRKIVMIIGDDDSGSGFDDGNTERLSFMGGHILACIVSTEICDSMDNDCDGLVDNIVPVECQSAPNSCGLVNTGTALCDGVCSAVTPENPASYGTMCNSSANTCGDVATGTMLCDGSCSAVTPENPASYGTMCNSSANTCGDVATGTILCDGSCSAVTPENPASYGTMCNSSANTCGDVATGTILCDGSCSAVTPENPASYGTMCNSSANTCGDVATGTILCDGSCSAVTPENPASYGTMCNSSANTCGDVATGTILCDGSCSAVTPENPASYGTMCNSSANTCGDVATGTILCDGSCSAVTPENPASYGTMCNSSANTCGDVATGTILCDGSCSAVTPSSSGCSTSIFGGCIIGSPGCPFTDIASSTSGINTNIPVIIQPIKPVLVISPLVLLDLTLGTPSENIIDLPTILPKTGSK